jgi:hypothetical protein
MAGTGGKRRLAERQEIGEYDAFPRDVLRPDSAQRRHRSKCRQDIAKGGLRSFECAKERTFAGGVNEFYRLTSEVTVGLRLDDL